MKKKLLFLMCCLLVLSFRIVAQELNARVSVNHSQIQTTNTELFTSMQNQLTEYINNRKWTDAKFAINERIDCNMTIIIHEMVNDNQFTAEIQVQVRRPVYNSGYSTTLLNFRDRQLDFEFNQYQPLEYSTTTLYDNLTATVMYYVYLILGFDFDSFSLKGGTSYFQQAQQIVNLAQSQASWTGWKAFDSNNNRHAVITALTDNTSDAFRTMWYMYHRRGLDEMAANADRGRTTVIESLEGLQQIKSLRPSSILLQMFLDSKLDEVIAIYSKATTQEKQEGYKVLSNIYPTESSRLDPLRR